MVVRRRVHVGESDDPLATLLQSVKDDVAPDLQLPPQLLRHIALEGIPLGGFSEGDTLAGGPEVDRRECTGDLSSVGIRRAKVIRQLEPDVVAVISSQRN